jgi:hypothetical protein
MNLKGQGDAVVASSLQDDLLQIQGVEGAEVDGSQDAPAGLRIRIAEGADQEAVGEEIRRVLSSHGLGTDTQLPGEQVPAAETEVDQGAVAVLTADDTEPSAPEGTPESEEDEDVGAIIDLTDTSIGILSSDEDISNVLAHETESPVASSTESSQAEARDTVPSFVERRPSVSVEQFESAEERPSPADVQDDAPEPSSVSLRDSIARIDSVAVVEGRSGIIVTVTASNGTEMSHVASSSECGVEAAVVKAAAGLVDPTSPDPHVVEIEDRRVEGVDIVMIIVDMDGELFAGSAVVGAGRAFALGRATWAALAL